MKKRLIYIYDTLLAHFGQQEWWPADNPFEVCIGAILTQNTAWTNVEKAISNLKRAELLDYKNLNAISEQRLAKLITPAGYFNVKAARLKSFLSFLHKECNGTIDNLFLSSNGLREKLLSVKGIGPETADTILLYAGDIPVFVIDAYTKRIFSRLGITKKEVSYNDLQSFFMKYLKKDTCLYNEYHALIVMLAKNYCKTRPICDSCPISHNCSTKR